MNKAEDINLLDVLLGNVRDMFWRTGRWYLKRQILNYKEQIKGKIRDGAAEKKTKTKVKQLCN